MSAARYTLSSGSSRMSVAAVTVECHPFTHDLLLTGHLLCSGHCCSAGMLWRVTALFCDVGVLVQSETPMHEHVEFQQSAKCLFSEPSLISSLGLPPVCNHAFFSCPVYLLHMLVHLFVHCTVLRLTSIYCVSTEPDGYFHYLK